MKTVIPNIWMLLFRLALLGLFIYIYQWPLAKITSGQYRANEPLFWLGLAVLTMFPVYIVWTFFGVLWVTISNNCSTIRFYYLYKIVEAKGLDIDSYYKTVNKTKVSIFKGFLIKLKSNNVVEVTEYNLKSVNQIGSFLRYNKAPLKGDKSSWFPLKRRI